VGAAAPATTDRAADHGPDDNYHGAPATDDHSAADHHDRAAAADDHDVPAGTAGATDDNDDDDGRLLDGAQARAFVYTPGR